MDFSVLVYEHSKVFRSPKIIERIIVFYFMGFFRVEKAKNLRGNIMGNT